MVAIWTNKIMWNGTCGHDVLAGLGGVGVERVRELAQLVALHRREQRHLRASLRSRRNNAFDEPIGEFGVPIKIV